MAGLDSRDYQMLYEHKTQNFAMRNEPSRRLRPNVLEVRPTEWSRDRSRDEKFDENEAVVRQYVEWAVDIATLITENLLSHPFLVLRRQCQVQPHSRRRHLIPVTLVPVVIRLHQCQGVTTLWKGLGSCLLVRGMTLAVEDILTKFTPWPKELPQEASFRTFGQHLLLKCVGLAVITPFYSASLVETVQSDIASEKPGLFDVFKEGLCRIIHWGSPARGRMLSVWMLMGPTVVHGLVKYLISRTVAEAAARTIHMKNRSEQSKRGAVHRDLLSEDGIQQVNVTASFIGMVTAEVLCYPLETVLHRLHLQGTRTIVDNLDSGSQVVPILTGYEGAMDCYTEVVAKEGYSGLYKGFGALILQFAVHWAVIRLTRTVVAKCAIMFRSQPRPPVPQPPPRFTQEIPPTTPSSLRHPLHASSPSLLPSERASPTSDVPWMPEEYQVDASSPILQRHNDYLLDDIN